MHHAAAGGSGGSNFGSDGNNGPRHQYTVTGIISITLLPQVTFCPKMDLRRCLCSIVSPTGELSCSPLLFASREVTAGVKACRRPSLPSFDLVEGPSPSGKISFERKENTAFTDQEQSSRPNDWPV
jgi:hypothetical protein